MIWTYPGSLWLLLLVPFSVLSAEVAAHRAVSRLSTILPGGLEWKMRIYLRDICMGGVLITAILALADPLGSRQPEIAESLGLDVALVLDISRSMLAEDISPDRLQRSIEALRQIISSLKGANFSLVVFKGNAEIVVPMTGDRIELEMWLQSISPGLSTSRGTNIEVAVGKALESFPFRQARSPLIILITDGEALSGQVDNMAKILTEKGVIVHSLSAGQKEGGVIPLGDGGFVKDKDGYVVVTRPDLKSLSRLARMTNGSLNELRDPEAVSVLVESIRKNRRFEEGRGIKLTRVKQYRFFLLISLFFLMVFFLARVLPWQKN